MPNRIASALAGAAALTLALSGIALADSVDADADVVISGTQSLINLGTVAGGSTHEVDFGFNLVCKGLSHVPVGSSVTLSPTATAPTGGTIGASAAVVGPVPPTWPAAGEACIDDPVLPATARSHVTLTAPTVAGTNFVYRVTYTKTPSSGISGGTLAQIVLSVDANEAPELDLPADFTVEGDTAGGWVAAYVAGATDAEDDPDPAAVCDPAPGVLLPLGSTTVSCVATDSAGVAATGSFQIDVVDTTPPELGTMPSPSVTTTDGAGAAATWSMPTATDVADPSPIVACDPASGSVFAVGTTTVTCTATDASGNASSASFPVVVTLETPPDPAPDPDPVPPGPDPVPPGLPAPPIADLAVVWHRPLDDGWTTARLGRSIPVKVDVFVDGDRLKPGTGRPTLVADRLDGCGDRATTTGTVELGTMRWTGRRWMLVVRTGRLDAGCWRLAIKVGDTAAGDTGLRLLNPRHRGHHGPHGHPARHGQRGHHRA